MAETSYDGRVKSLTIRLPPPLVAEIEAESRARQITKSDVVRERLSAASGRGGDRHASFEAIADLVGSVDDLPVDLAARRKAYLKKTGYGRKRPR